MREIIIDVRSATSVAHSFPYRHRHIKPRQILIFAPTTIIFYLLPFLYRFPLTITFWPCLCLVFLFHKTLSACSMDTFCNHTAIKHRTQTLKTSTNIASSFYQIFKWFLLHFIDHLLEPHLFFSTFSFSLVSIDLFQDYDNCWKKE